MEKRSAPLPAAERGPARFRRVARHAQILALDEVPSASAARNGVCGSSRRRAVVGCPPPPAAVNRPPGAIVGCSLYDWVPWLRRPPSGGAAPVPCRGSSFSWRRGAGRAAAGRAAWWGRALIAVGSPAAAPFAVGRSGSCGAAKQASAGSKRVRSGLPLSPDLPRARRAR